MAHTLALANDHIKADVVEANEFPELSRRYRVSAVPTTAISRGDKTKLVVGSLPEDRFIDEIISLLEPTADETGDAQI